MGWKDLFKGKAPKAEADPRLRWFGKLPTYADYYSSATDQEWAVEFNDWVLKGFEMYLSRRAGGAAGRTGGGGTGGAGGTPGGLSANALEARLPMALCALRLPKSGMTVLAYIEDFGGDMRGRPFPLCFYVGVPSVSWPGPTSANVPAGLCVLRGLMALRPLIFRFFNNPGRFEGVFGGREIKLDDLGPEARDTSWQSAARSLPLADWFQATRPCLKASDLETWLELASGWGASIAKLDCEDFGPTLRFPLSMAWPFEVQVTGWLCWLEQRMNLKDRLASLLICKCADEATGHLSVVARDVVPEDYLLSTSLSRTLNYVDDLSLLTGPKEPVPVAGSTEHESAAAGAVRAPETWSDFVGSEVRA
jgi:hypothetical protein